MNLLENAIKAINQSKYINTKTDDTLIFINNFLSLLD